MKKILVLYYSLTGFTEMMAQYIAEGIRIVGQTAVLKKVSDIEKPDELAGFDGYVFGSPTQFRDIPEPMKNFLRIAAQAELKGKLGGAFGSYKHDGSAPAIIFETMQYALNMEPFELGPLNLKETTLEPYVRGQDKPQWVAGEVHSEKGEGMRACHDYGKVFGQKLGT